jgi:hypothetical protein
MRVDLLQELLQIKFGLLLWVVLVFVTVAHVPAERSPIPSTPAQVV